MPHLHRNPFIPNEVPADLDPKEKVYYCESTGEIFRYEISSYHFCKILEIMRILGIMKSTLSDRLRLIQKFGRVLFRVNRI